MTCTEGGRRSRTDAGNTCARRAAARSHRGLQTDRLRGCTLPPPLSVGWPSLALRPGPARAPLVQPAWSPACPAISPASGSSSRPGRGRPPPGQRRHHAAQPAQAAGRHPRGSTRLPPAAPPRCGHPRTASEPKGLRLVIASHEGSLHSMGHATWRKHPHAKSRQHKALHPAAILNPPARPLSPAAAPRCAGHAGGRAPPCASQPTPRRAATPAPPAVRLSAQHAAARTGAVRG